MKKIPLLALATSMMLMAWPTNTSTIPTPSTTSYPGRGGSSSIPTPHNPVPGSRDDSGFNGNYIPPTTNNGAYQGSTTIDKLKAGDNGVYRGHGTSTSTNVSFDTGGNSGGGAPVPPPAPAVYKFNQRDGYQSDLEKGLREVAKRAGGSLNVVKGYTVPGDGWSTPSGFVRGYYEFKNIKKTITWKICVNSSVSNGGACTQLPTITVSNQGNYRFRWQRNKESGADKDGIQVYGKKMLNSDIWSYKYKSVYDPNIMAYRFVKVKDKILAKKGAYYGRSIASKTSFDGLRMSHYGSFDFTSNSIASGLPNPDNIYIMRTNPRHYEVTFK